MKKKCFSVPFELDTKNRTEAVWATCTSDAIILAQAKQIKKGNRCDDVLKDNIKFLE